MGGFIKNNGLSLVLFGLFLFSLGGQYLTGGRSITTSRFPTASLKSMQ